MPTEILAKGTTAATSTVITVVAGTPITVGLFRADEGPIEADCICPILREDPDGNDQPTGLVLNGINPNIVLIGPGLYFVDRPGSLKTATGVQTD